MADRRIHTRHRINFPVQIDSERKKDRIGVARNVSVRGLLLGTPSRFQPGERVTLELVLASERAERERVTGRVVRVSEDGDAGWFARLIAVEFDRDVPRLAPPEAALGV
jgi:hypothetical protein